MLYFGQITTYSYLGPASYQSESTILLFHIFILTKAVRFSTLEAICQVLGCQPGDLLEYVPDEAVVAATLP